MITLSYNDDLARVQIDITALPFDEGAIRIEWSTNELYWTTVRGAEELVVTAGSASVDHYEFRDGIPNHYRVIPLDPVAGLYLSGAEGGYASTPDHASLRITGDLDIRAELVPDSWTGSTQTIAARYDTATDNRSYQMIIRGSDGHLQMLWSPDGTLASSVTSSSAAATTEPAVRGSLDADGGAGNRVVVFWEDGTVDGPWTGISTDNQTPDTSIFAGTAPLEIGARKGALASSANEFSGRIDRVQVRAGIDGTIVADPRFDQQTMGATSFTDDPGRLWTVHGDAHIVGTESASITPDLGGRVWLTHIKYPSLNRWAYVTDWSPISRDSNDTLHHVAGRSTPIAVTDVGGSQTFTLEIATRDLIDDSFDSATEARDLDLILAVRGTYFINVPATGKYATVPGGYVSIGTTSQRPAPSRRAGQAAEIFSVPCTVVTPPGAGVVGTTLTWGTVLNLYGNWEALLAANATWNDLLALVGSPDDLVVF